jgi:hypothetical protein
MKIVERGRVDEGSVCGFVIVKQTSIYLDYVLLVLVRSDSASSVLHSCSAKNSLSISSIDTSVCLERVCSCRWATKIKPTDIFLYGSISNWLRRALSISLSFASSILLMPVFMAVLQCCTMPVEQTALVKFYC